MREVGAYNYDDLGILIASVVLIMSGPPVYAAINYMILSRVLFYMPYISPMHPGRVITTFLAIDGIVEILIGQGASRMANSSESDAFREVGANLVKSALIIQAVMFLLFIWLAAHFHRKAAKEGILPRNIRTVLIVLYTSSAIVTIRCIYRIVEFFEGWTGTLYTNEPYFWVFDAALMFVNTLILNIWHPGRRLPPSNKTYLAKDGVTELRGPGWKDKRNFLVTLIDPFDLVGLFQGVDKKTAFWNMSPEELDALEQESRQKKIERANRPRQAWQKIIDPLHVFGHSGGLARWFKKMERPHQRVSATRVTEGGATEDATKQNGNGHAKQETV